MIIKLHGIYKLFGKLVRYADISKVCVVCVRMHPYMLLRTVEKKLKMVLFFGQRVYKRYIYYTILYFYFYFYLYLYISFYSKIASMLASMLASTRKLLAYLQELLAFSAFITGKYWRWE